MIDFPVAKINLGLNITHRRPDGYHDVDTVMCRVGWSDILEMVPARGVETTLTTTGNIVDCPPEKNLVVKAYNALAAEHPIPPADIFLHKNIPDGAGMGGGSADAAYTIAMLNKMFGLGLDRAELSRIAAKVGSDCAFFMFDEPMHATGRGEILTSCPELNARLDGKYILIVKPEGCSVSTAKAYAAIKPSQRLRTTADIVARVPLPEWRGMLTNDFEPVVFEAFPQVAALKESMYGCGAVYASMTGSGSAVYGIFDSCPEYVPEPGLKMFGFVYGK